MTKKFVEKLCCTFDKSDLNLEVFTEDAEGKIHEGLFTCPECNRLYPVVHGVPLMIPDDYRQLTLERPFFEKWNDRLSLEVREKLRLGA